MKAVMPSVKRLKADILKRRATIKDEDKALLAQLKLVREMEHVGTSNGSAAPVKAKPRRKGHKIKANEKGYTGRDGSISWAQASRLLLLASRKGRMTRDELYAKIIKKGLREPSKSHGPGIVSTCLKNNPTFRLNQAGEYSLKTDEPWW